MKSSIKIFAIASLFVGVYSCKKVDFGDYNFNPASDRTQTPQTANLLTNAIWASVRTLSIADMTPTLYVQYLSQTQYPDVSLYQYDDGFNFTAYYAGPLQDLQTIININTTTPTGANVTSNGSNKNQIAVAKIFQAYLYYQVTERFGDIPLTQALNGNIQPKYDKQMDVYVAIINMLKEGIAGFDGGAAVKGDILFNGDATKWKKFANSLRIIMAMRTTKADAAFAKAQFLDAYNDAAGHITTTADNANFKFIGGGFNNPYYDEFSTRQDYGVSEGFVNRLTTISDPRVTTMFTKPGTNYKGVPYGRNRSYMLNTWLPANPDYSIPGPRITQVDASLPLISAAEVLFVQAEAAALGWIPVNSGNDYYNGIKASMEQWGITDATAINTYIARSEVTIGTTYAAGALQKIYLQKYISLFMVGGLEAWSEWRRTGVPALTPAPDAVNVSKQIPRKENYPSSENGVNKINYQNVINDVYGGVNSQDSRVWWDK